jgi:hypothetical protein
MDVRNSDEVTASLNFETLSSRHNKPKGKEGDDNGFALDAPIIAKE